MIELPWNSDEEKYLCKCLLDCAIHDPSTTTGNLLVGKSMQLLSPIQQQLVKDGLLRFGSSTPSEEIDFPGKSNTTVEEELPTYSSSFVIPSNTQSSSSIVLPAAYPNNPLKSSLHHQTPTALSGSSVNRRFDNGKYGSAAVLLGRLFENQEAGLINQGSLSRNLKFDDVSTPLIRRVSPVDSTQSKEMGRSSNRHLHHYYQHDGRSEMKANGFPGQVTAKQRLASSKNHGFDGDDSMDVTQSAGEKASVIDERVLNGGPRWRSDETSDDEEEESPGRAAAAAFTASRRGNRRVRIARR